MVGLCMRGGGVICADHHAFLFLIHAIDESYLYGGRESHSVARGS